MKRIVKIGLLGTITLLVLGIIAWYPYRAGVVPAWKIQIVDSTGHSMAGVMVQQEWLEPVDEGTVSGDQQKTDPAGFVTFSERILRNRLVLGFPVNPPSARIFVCTDDEYGEVLFGKEHPELARELRLRKGPCPFG